MYRATLSFNVLAFSSALALVAPLAVSTAHAQGRPQPQIERAVPRNSQAYNEGYQRGTRAGGDDGQRNREFRYDNKSDYRNGDAGYRREYGDRGRWQIEFRLGFETGYRDGYNRYRPGYGGGNGRYDDRYGSNGRYGGPPPWANGRGRGGYQYTDIAFRNGFTDGYDEGVKDAERRDRFNPTDEGRYRSADHGYNNRYGSRDAYRQRYREGFREGYERGFEDGRRYDSRNNRYDGRPWWWPW